MKQIVEDSDDPTLVAKFTEATAAGAESLPQSAKDELFEGIQQEADNKGQVDDLSIECYRNLKRLGMMMLLPEGRALRAGFEQVQPQMPDALQSHLREVEDAHKDFLKRHGMTERNGAPPR